MDGTKRRPDPPDPAPVVSGCCVRWSSAQMTWVVEVRGGGCTQCFCFE
jgi:hypothetical protein